MSPSSKVIFLQMKNTNQIAKEKIGFTTEVENNIFIGKSDIELISLLKSNNPKERTSFEILEKSLQKYSDDEIIKWKITRALSAFPCKKSKLILLNILKISKKPEFEWEAVRSLGLICKEVPEELLITKNDKNDNVKKMVFLAINKIEIVRKARNF